MTITARVLRDGVVIAEAALRYAGEVSTYEGALDIDGDCEVEVIAANAKTANFGRAMARVSSRS